MVNLGNGKNWIVDLLPFISFNIKLYETPPPIPPHKNHKIKGAQKASDLAWFGYEQMPYKQHMPHGHHLSL